MYYPYLRGKQFELLALRELSKTGALPDYSHVCPILEPLKADASANQNAIGAMLNCGMRFALILNPFRGEFGPDSGEFAQETFKFIRESGDTFWIPAFLIDSNADLARKIIRKYRLENVMLVAQEDVDLEKIRDLIDSGVVKYLVSPESKMNMRKIQRLKRKPALIRLDDKFPPVKRNDDYRNTKESPNNEDQLFSEEYLFYKDDHYDGFADYTLLTKMLTDGGALPYVVAIHLTYLGKDDEIRVRHFLSDSNSKGRENIQRKFAEAAEKAKMFFAKRNDRTAAVDELVLFLEDGHYPGLGSIKKLSIKHHIQLVDRLLREESRR